MGLHGQALGAELGEIYRAGKRTLPAVAADYATAWLHTPDGVAPLTKRGGGLGADPGPKLDQLAERLSLAVSATRDALQDVADRLVWTATDYEGTDQAAQDEFDRRRKEVDG
jgi:hypothetical protein